MKRALALVLVAVSAAGCGGSSGSSSGSGLSKADYLKAAEKICAQANTDQDALKTPTSIGGLAPYVARIVAIADTATTGIAALDPPEADAADLTAKVLDPLKAQLALGHDYADKVAAAAKDNKSADLLKLLSDPPNDTMADLRYMKDYGFDECVDAADTSG